MKTEHIITGIVVLGIAYLIFKPKNDKVLDTAKVTEESTLSFDAIDDSMADMSQKNIFKSKARFNLR
jgi:hypothetical protein